MKNVFAAGLALAFLATPAFAKECPKLWAQVDEAMKTATLADADKAKVEELRKKGEEQHKTGDHAGSEASLNEALEMLGKS